MQSARSRPSRLYTVEFWIDRPGQGDVTTLRRGEPGLAYHIRIQTVRAVPTTVYLRSKAFGGSVGSNPLVLFPHNNSSEWVCSVEVCMAQSGADNHAIDVSQNNTGQSTLEPLDLVLIDSYGAIIETVNSQLTLTVR
jgi:hypothetical protein